MSGKARIGLRLKEKAGKKAKNRSGELVAMAERFELLKSKMKLLVAALKAQHASIMHINKTRLEVAKQVASIADQSPIYDQAGLLPSSETPKGTVLSYASVHQAMASRSKMYADRYKQFVVEYAIEWEKVVVTRISSDLKESEKFRRDLDHYQNKVESLRKSVNQTMAKGKLVDPKQAEKLKRNEEKLTKSREEYEEFATNLCVLIEEVTERSWKDLHPLLIKMTQFDATLSADEAKTFADLNIVTDNLKRVAQQHGLKPQARLKDLQQLSAQLVSTKGAENSLRLEDGLSGPGGGLADGLSQDAGGGGILSPVSQSSIDGGGAVSPVSFTGGAIGGDSAPVTRSSSFSSVGSFASGGAPRSTSEMMAVASASAPPPTLEMLNDATRAMSFSSPSDYGARNISSASLPPLPPSSGQSNWSRSSSFQADTPAGYISDGSSRVSGPMAPAPAAPPPPPPPAPALSMYSGPVDVDTMPVTAPSTAMAPQSQSMGYGNYSMNAMNVPAPSAPPSATAHPWSSGAAQSPAPAPYGAPQAPGTNPFHASPIGGSIARSSSNPFDD